jgi:hypothetical protein
VAPGPVQSAWILVSVDVRTAPHHADLPVAFEHRKRDVGDVPDVAVEPQVFQHVMFAEPISPREFLIQCSLPNDDVAATLDEIPKDVRSSSPIRQGSMEDREHESSTQGGEECGGTIDGARQHRRQNESEYRIECSLLRQETAVATPDNGERRDEHDDAAETDLQKRQCRGFVSEAQQRIEIKLHTQDETYLSIVRGRRGPTITRRIHGGDNTGLTPTARGDTSE